MDFESLQSVFLLTLLLLLLLLSFTISQTTSATTVTPPPPLHDYRSTLQTLRHINIVFDKMQKTERLFYPLEILVSALNKFNWGEPTSAQHGEGNKHNTIDCVEQISSSTVENIAAADGK